MRIRQLNHTVYQTNYHIVWGTKYRRKYLKEYVRNELVKALYRIQRRFPDWYLIKMNTGEDHVHVLMEIPPKYSISEVVQKLKAESALTLKQKFKFIRNIYGDTGIWSTGYFVSTVGLNEAQIRKYIERQNNFDRGVDLTDEFGMRSKETPHDR